jgi:tetratricopeptide (TPR) repeat protein
MIRYCPQCNRATANLEARFCRYCGARLHPVSSATTSFTHEEQAKLQTTRMDSTEVEDLLNRPSGASTNGMLDETETVVSRKPAGAADLPTGPAATLSSEAASESPAHPNFESSAARPVVALETPQPSVRRRNVRWWIALAVCAATILIVAVISAWYIALRSFRTQPVEEVAIPPTPTADARAAAEAKMAEADVLLATGQIDAAIARLREAVALDPTNANAYRKLGNALLTTGARKEAINAFLAAVANDPNDRAAWRALADAQMDEGLYAEAAESYRKLFALAVDPTGSEDAVRLRWAEALLRSGRSAEARTLLQSLLLSPMRNIASEARRRLSELLPNTSASPSAASGSPTPSERSPQTDEARTGPGPGPAPTAQPPTSASPAAPSPRERFERGVQLWGQNRAAALEEFRAASRGGIADAYYYLGLSIAEGRDPRSLSRAELVSALYYFQLARAGGGRTAAQARHYEEILGREYDRRRGFAPQR